jgi:hypothetical protein
MAEAREAGEGGGIDGECVCERGKWGRVYRACRHLFHRYSQLVSPPTARLSPPRASTSPDHSTTAPSLPPVTSGGVNCGRGRTSAATCGLGRRARAGAGPCSRTAKSRTWTGCLTSSTSTCGSRRTGPAAGDARSDTGRCSGRVAKERVGGMGLWGANVCAELFQTPKSDGRIFFAAPRGPPPSLPFTTHDRHTQRPLNSFPSSYAPAALPPTPARTCAQRPDPPPSGPGGCRRPPRRPRPRTRLRARRCTRG